MSGPATGASSSPSWAGSPSSAAPPASWFRNGRPRSAAPSSPTHPPCPSAPASTSCSVRCSRSSAIVTDNHCASTGALKSMNKPITASDLVTPKVTTGPLVGSRKIYSNPEAAPDLRVPLREIILSEGANEPNLPVYDTTGAYTDNDAVVDVENGLKRTRIEWAKGRGVEKSAGPPIQRVDNGSVSGKHLARNFPNTPKPWRAVGDAPVTQYE